MYLCQNCGAELSPGLVKCRYCGTAAAGPQTPAGVPYPPPMPGAALPTIQPVPLGVEQKSKLAAGLLGIFLGALGIHNFYLGFNGKGTAQLLISVLSCGYLAIVTGIWGLVEGIMILTGSTRTDARGVPLKD